MRLKILIYGLLMLMMFSCHTKQVNKSLRGLKSLPPFTILSLDSTHILKSEAIAQGSLLVFFLFDPTCTHCQKMTNEISDNEAKLKKVKFFFVSDADALEIDTFSRDHHLDHMANVYVGRDFQFSFYNAFTPSSIPYIAIYNRDRHLSKIFNGEANIDSLITSTEN